MQLWLGLTLAFISAIAVNWAYAREHDAAAAMPPFSPRRPVRFVSLLLSNHRWLVGFATETAGWLVYVAALRLAPLSLVQAICASGIAVLAFATAHGHPTRLARHEQIAVVIASAGLVLLSLSLVGTRPADHPPGWTTVALWLGCSAAAALTLARIGIGLARGPALGLAAGLLFAGGDIFAKLVVYGGIWFVAVLSLIVCYALGTSILQGAFQHGDALTPPASRPSPPTRYRSPQDSSSLANSYPRAQRERCKLRRSPRSLSAPPFSPASRCRPPQRNP